MKTCPRCGHADYDDARFCSSCGNEYGSTYQQPDAHYQYQQPRNDNPFDVYGPEGKSRGIAALLAILLGGLGVQYFYLNKIGGGVLCILLSIITCGIWQVVMVVQGVLMLCMTNEQFRQKYVLSQSIMPLF